MKERASVAKARKLAAFALHVGRFCPDDNHSPRRNGMKRSLPIAPHLIPPLTGDAVTAQHLHQLVEQNGAIADRSFEIRFLDPGVQAYAFTFG